MAVKPLDDRVLVKPLEAEEKTKGGIILPNTAKEKPQQGVIVAVGPGKLLDSGERVDVSVNIGQTVLFGKYGGTDIKIDGVEHKIMRISEIFAIIES